MFIKTLTKNLPIFSNWQTILVTFILEPFFSVLFFYLISPYTNKEKLLLTAIVLTTIYKVMSVYSQIFVHAQNIDILKLIFINKRGFLLFNLTAYSIAILVAMIQSGILIALYSVFNITIQIGLQQLVIITALTIIYTIIISAIVVITFIGAQNPYFGSNLLSGLLPIISATVVPINFYPDWLALISRVLPFWLIQTAVWSGNVNATAIIVYIAVYATILYTVFTYRRKKILKF